MQVNDWTGKCPFCNGKVKISEFSDSSAFYRPEISVKAVCFDCCMEFSHTQKGIDQLGETMWLNDSFLDAWERIEKKTNSIET